MVSSGSSAHANDTHCPKSPSMASGETKPRGHGKKWKPNLRGRVSEEEKRKETGVGGQRRFEEGGEREGSAGFKRRGRRRLFASASCGHAGSGVCLLQISMEGGRK